MWTGVGHRVGAYSRGVGRDLFVGAWTSWFTPTDWAEPGRTLGKVSNRFAQFFKWTFILLNTLK